MIDQNNNSLELANKNLANALEILEKTVGHKIEKIQNHNFQVNQATNKEKEFLKNEIKELTIKNTNIKAAGQRLANEIKADLEKVKNIINK